MRCLHNYTWLSSKTCPCFLIKKNLEKKSLHIYLVCLHTCMPQNACRGQRATCRSWFSSSSREPWEWNHQVWPWASLLAHLDGSLFKPPPPFFLTFLLFEGSGHLECHCFSTWRPSPLAFWRPPLCVSVWEMEVALLLHKWVPSPSSFCSVYLFAPSFPFGLELVILWGSWSLQGLLWMLPN